MVAAFDKQEAKKNVKENFYIKRNIRTVQKIDKDLQTRKFHSRQEPRTGHLPGVLPNYLKNRKKEAEKERLETLQQIELNKRPQGTTRLRQQEIEYIRENLNQKRQELVQNIEKMSVTLYTQRAKK